jgi:hypothetical protein
MSPRHDDIGKDRIITVVEASDVSTEVREGVEQSPKQFLDLGRAIGWSAKGNHVVMGAGKGCDYSFGVMTVLSIAVLADQGLTPCLEI